jgi:5-bromo-4-chloroindolyl phosphate hydrolysis protein
MMKIDLTQAQVELLREILAEEIQRVERASVMPCRSQILQSLRSVNKKIEAQKTV